MWRHIAGVKPPGKKKSTGGEQWRYNVTAEKTFNEKWQYNDIGERRDWLVHNSNATTMSCSICKRYSAKQRVKVLLNFTYDEKAKRAYDQNIYTLVRSIKLCVHMAACYSP